MGGEVPLDLGDEVPVQGSSGRGCGADAGLVAADLPGPGSGDCARCGVSGPRAYAGERAAAAGSGQAGAVSEGAVEPDVAGRVSAIEEAVLGPASVGAGTFARAWVRWTKRRSGGTSKTNSGTIRGRTSRSPRPPSLEPALSRGLEAASAANRRLSVATPTYRQPV